MHVYATMNCSGFADNLTLSPPPPVFFTQLVVSKPHHWSRILREPRSRRTDLHLLWDTERSRATAWQASKLCSSLRKTAINSKSPWGRLQRPLWTIYQDSWKTLRSRNKLVSFFRFFVQNTTSMSEVFVEFHLFLIFLANMDTWKFYSWKLSNRNQWGCPFEEHKYLIKKFSLILRHRSISLVTKQKAHIVLHLFPPPLCPLLELHSGPAGKKWKVWVYTSHPPATKMPWR